MPIVVRRAALRPTLEIGTQYIQSGVTLYLQAPTFVDMSSSLFSTPASYVIFSVDPAATFDDTTVGNLVVTGIPANMEILCTAGNDAFWDSSTRTVKVTLVSSATNVSTAGRQIVVGDLELAQATPVNLDAGAYTGPGTYTLFKWTGNFVYPNSYSNPTEAINALLTVNPPAGRTVSGVSYRADSKTILVTLA